MADTTAKQRAARLADELEQVLRDIGAWTEDPSTIPEPRGAFGGQSVSFEQWLQVVLIERLRQIARGELELPGKSALAAYAARELDGAPFDTGPLLDVLRRIDALAGR